MSAAPVGPPPAPPPASRRRARRLAAAFAGTAVAILALATWLLASESGLAALARLAAAASGGRLQVTGTSGRLSGPLAVAEIAWQDGGSHFRIAGLRLEWTPSALLSGRLEIARLAAAEVAFATPPDETRPAPPDSLRLPLAIHLGRLEIGRLRKGGSALAESLAAAFDSDGTHHRLHGLRLLHPFFAAEGEAELEGDQPFRLTARARLSGRLAERDFELALAAAGPLAAIAVDGKGSGALQGTLKIEATPFAAQAFSRLQAHLKGIDPAAWVPDAPAANIELDAELLPRPGAEALAVAGPFSLRNALAGRLDAGRLPLVRLSGRVEWQGERARFDALAAELSGGGRLRGEALLRGKRLELDLKASAIDAAALHGRLLPSRLGGPLHAQLEAETQTLRAELADRDYRIAVAASRRQTRVEVGELLLAAGSALLRASGYLDLGADKPFAAQGELIRFDPARFVRRLPPAQINAGFETAGRLQPQPAATLSFRLRDSRFNGQPLVGRGDLELVWPQLRKAEISLGAGRNRIEAHGAFGRPGDRLEIAIEAPELAPYGFEGGLRGTAQISGSLPAPAVDADLEAERLGLPGVVRLRGLRLRARIGAGADDPLAIDLGLESLTPAEGSGAGGITLRVEGSRARHRLDGAATLGATTRLALGAVGGLGDSAGGGPRWSGEVQRFELLPARREGEMRLQAPAPLRLGATEWAFGPAELAGPEWQGRLQAAAAGGRLHAVADGHGPRLGDISARLDAGLSGAWKLAPDTPWDGRLAVASGDLAWLGTLIGEGWQTAGRLQADVHLAGTPARPRLDGRLAGSGLALTLAEPGLRLRDGELAAVFDERRLQLARLEFASVLRPPPQPLLAQAAGGELAVLGERPGQLSVQGEIGLPGSGSETGSLEFRLDRVGALQLPEQWIVLSGSGRLRWRDEHLAVGGRLRADAGWWELARLGTPRLSDDVVVRRTGSAPAPARRPEIEIDLEADLGQRFHFSGAGVDARLAGSIRLRAAGGDLPRASGSIRTVGGRFDAYGQKLGIERGIINFQGLLDNPSLNIRAVRKGLPVEAGVEVVGTAKRPEVRLVSDPEVPDAEKLSWLVLGHGSEQTGSGDASTLLAAASGLFGGNSGGGVVQHLQQRFGIDEFGVRQGQLGDSGSRQASSRIVGGGGFDAAGAAGGSQIVTVGKRIAANAVLSYEQALGRAENIVKLTVNLSRRLSVVGRTGSDNAIDLFYTFAFGR